jgi:hypothetical protein
MSKRKATRSKKRHHLTARALKKVRGGAEIKGKIKGVSLERGLRN